jgi:glycosyltransferase involved in cell wall biosynthesis
MPFGLKTTIEELVAMPDRNAGWIVPAIFDALRLPKPDAIFSSAPPWSGHLVAYVLARLWGCPWVADFRDPWVRSPWGRYQSRIGRAIGSSLEGLVIRRATAVLFTTNTARQEFQAHYGDSLGQRFHTIQNGCDPGEFSHEPPARMASDEPFVILHAGSLYGGRSPLPIIRAIADLCSRRPQFRRRLRVRFLGASGIPEGDTARISAELGVQELVEFVPRVSRQESLVQMRRSGALLILQSGLTLAIPGKLYEYFAAGRPVLALCEEGEMADIIRSSGAGLVVTSDQVTELAGAIEDLILNSTSGWLSPDPAFFDGSLRAAEMAAVLERAMSGSHGVRETVHASATGEEQR